jgi:hypothetical protein
MVTMGPQTYLELELKKKPAWTDADGERMPAQWRYPGLNAEEHPFVCDAGMRGRWRFPRLTTRAWLCYAAGGPGLEWDRWFEFAGGETELHVFAQDSQRDLTRAYYATIEENGLSHVFENTYMRATTPPALFAFMRALPVGARVRVWLEYEA